MKCLRNSLLVILIFQACSEPKPIIAASNDEIFIDSIGINETKIINYTIYNKGSAVLKILSFTCSCDCTVPEIKPNQEIDANDSLPIRIFMKPKSWDIGKSVGILCTFKTNADSIFTRLKIGYIVKS